MPGIPLIISMFLSGNRILGIKEEEGLCVDDPVSKVFKQLAGVEDRNTVRELNYFNKEVPRVFFESLD